MSEVTWTPKHGPSRARLESIRAVRSDPELRCMLAAHDLYEENQRLKAQAASDEQHIAGLGAANEGLAESVNSLLHEKASPVSLAEAKRYGFYAGVVWAEHKHCRRCVTEVADIEQASIERFPP